VNECGSDSVTYSSVVADNHNSKAVCSNTVVPYRCVQWNSFHCYSNRSYRQHCNQSVMAEDSQQPLDRWRLLTVDTTLFAVMHYSNSNPSLPYY
jgi:hypothetical protein